MLNLVLFGAPGSGKGTQSAKLIDQYGLYHISTGELLRDQIARQTPLGKIADKYISKGELIPDDLMNDMLEQELEKHVKEGQGVVFDGYPRTIHQAETLEEILNKRGSKLHAVICLDVDNDELIKRMINRGIETGRLDDNLDTIKKRLEVYEQQTLPLSEYYNTRDMAIHVDGHDVVDNVFNDIALGIEKKTGRKPRCKNK